MACEVTITKFLRYVTSYFFVVISNGFVTFQIALKVILTEPLHLKLGNGCQVTLYIYPFKKVYIVTFLLTGNLGIVFNLLDRVTLVTVLKVQ